MLIRNVDLPEPMIESITLISLLVLWVLYMIVDIGVSFPVVRGIDDTRSVTSVYRLVSIWLGVWVSVYR